MKRFVYVQISESSPDRHYVGLTSDVENRVRWHNVGPDGQTRLYRPWRLSVSMEFADGRVAARFERHLKSGSGRAFAKRHFEL
jgi:predicted GIY-YIG superfamily endonuclease